MRWFRLSSVLVATAWLRERRLTSWAEKLEPTSKETPA